jgi:hypothetical protein
MESIEDALNKRFGKSLVHLMKVIDPERHYSIDETLGKKWDSLSLEDQRRLYLYLLYRKWRGLDIYGEPYYIITNCHPAPFNWNGVAGINTLMKQNKLVIAKHNGSYGTYTRDEAKVWQMTDVKPLNF